MDHKNNVAVDKVSELLDYLQQHILSYLSINEVFQPSILYKRWKHVWTVVPVLKVHTTLFGSSEMKKNLDIQRKLWDFCIFVEKTLGRHCKQRLTIKEFSLIHCLDNRKSFSLVDRWINYVVKSDVKKLSLIFVLGYCIFDEDYYYESVIPFSSNTLALSAVSYQMQDIAPWNVEEIEFLAKLSNSKLLTLTMNLAKDMVIRSSNRRYSTNSIFGLQGPGKDTISFKFSYERPILALLQTPSSSVLKALPKVCDN
ncbi:F-box protein At3g59000-like [Quercus lobata]|uniref:F-box protein At3g59000-like n=1 Tax=Quercus lobata TaxID=97700 RepID=UPI001248F08B|nr:F-box protein At3g59000-like [Quercus lobata]